ncbi:peptide ABC transporter substrate-binding protein [Tropheryma whipplei]|uniref:peptide ABC transporter substrate-binding protein n=1 Tax=Tropheryma whipplei TaxID=2039 RepID=UPI0004AF64F8|nr:ABC transporter substrate-binding protein [Tropheryma whipplei]MCO8182886.1 ABC transporter substrate-binding protein [Tropheryma whipplei]
MNSRFKFFAAFIPVVLFMAACFGGSPGVKGKEMRFGSCEPQTALLPGSVRDECGSGIVTNLFVGLVTRDREGNLINEVAESIETQDNLTYVIKVKKDWKFSNGEKVTAKSFVDAWNFTAKKSNAQSNRDDLKYIDGYSADLDGDLSGLKITDEFTFTVKLNKKLNDFSERLSNTTAFFPLPSVAYQDIKKFGQNPIGNGPYLLHDRRKNVSWSYRPNRDYHGYASQFPIPPSVRVTVYQSGSAKYADYLAGNLDLVDVPQENIETYKQDSEGRHIEGVTSVVSYIGITANTPGFELNTEAGKLRRRALSLAIDRQEMGDKLYHGLRFPATGFFSSAFFPNYADLPGSDVLKFNLEKAKEFWAEAEKLSPYPRRQIDFFYNVDGGHKIWIDAVVNQLKNGLGITNIIPKPVPTFREFLDLVDQDDFSGFFRSGWQTGYIAAPSIETLFTSDGSNNSSRYRNPEFDKLAVRAVEAKTSESASLYKELLGILLKDLPLIPLFGYKDALVYGKDVKGIKLNKRGIVDTSDMIRE